MNPHLQRLEALSAANERRIEWAKIKQQLRTGELSLADVLFDPPDAVLDQPLLDVLRARRRGRRSEGLTTVNHWAVRDGVNLMLPVGRASRMTRDWVVQHGDYWFRPSHRRVAA